MGKRAASHKGKTANRANLGVGEAAPWWKILKVSATASLDEVAIAFRELAMQFHPDLWANATEDQRKVADSRMKMINAAFEKAEHDINARQKFTAKVEQEAAIKAKQKTVAKAQQKATVRTKRKSAAKAKQEPIDTASQVMSNLFLNPTNRKKLRKTKKFYVVVVSVLAVLIFALIHIQREYAATHLEQAIAKAKQEAIAKATLAYESKNEWDWDKAIRDCSNVIQLDSNIAEVYLERGKIYFYKKGEFDKAIADFSEAIRLEPKYSSAYRHRGWAYKNKREWDKAIADFTETIRLDPENAKIYIMRRCEAYVSKQEWDKAIADYTDLIRIDPENVYAYVGRGEAYKIKREWDKAISDFSEAIRLEPTNWDVYLRRSETYKLKGDLYKAKKDYEKAKELGYKP